MGHSIWRGTVLLVVALQVCVLELLVLRAASVEGAEVTWGFQVEQLDTIGLSYGRVQNRPY